MAGSPQHATLVGGVVTTLTFDVDFNRLEFVNVDGADAVYIRTGSTSNPPTDPAVAGTGCHVLPAAICAMELDIYTAGATVVKLISAGTPKVSVRGIS